MYNFIDQSWLLLMSVQCFSSSIEGFHSLSTTSYFIITPGLRQVTCVFCGGVGQVESTATVVGPTHELDSDLVAG